jgi:hypothetical protein
VRTLLNATLQKRTMIERARIFAIAKRADEIWIFCNNRVRMRARRRAAVCAHARRFSLPPRIERRGVHSKNFLHSLPFARVPRGRNRSKNAESASGDSLPPIANEGEF